MKLLMNFFDELVTVVFVIQYVDNIHNTVIVMKNCPLLHIHLYILRYLGFIIVPVKYLYLFNILSENTHTEKILVLSVYSLHSAYVHTRGATNIHTYCRTRLSGYILILRRKQIVRNSSVAVTSWLSTNLQFYIKNREKNPIVFFCLKYSSSCVRYTYLGFYKVL